MRIAGLTMSCGEPPSANPMVLGDRISAEATRIVQPRASSRPSRASASGAARKGSR